ncbi:MAG: Co2+/Mg2+ efflux protein ApaG [Crocinitomicaceae bacterium]
MNTAISEGVQVTVYTQFRPDLSKPDSGSFFFNYRIEIVNNNNFKIQLLHRDWYIFDSLQESTFVSGEGVVGEQPVLLPSEHYTYTSGAELNSEIGYMKGYYTFINLTNNVIFQVHVPNFQLIDPIRLN